ncbi:MAG: hypothetical protein HBSAPP03_21030 [Phycisphaerae bacterium]|nr:MAG: hypothetical protein HBSAPP03_21030 [Phycisphaerae bacterium]
MDRIRAYALRTSIAFFKPCGPALMARAVRTLGDEFPDLRALLPDDTSRLHVRWFATLEQIVERCEQFHKLERVLGDAGASAAAAGFTPAHYPIVRDTLLAAMHDLAGEDWTPELEKSWRLLLDATSGAMIAGAFRHRHAA